MATLLPEGKQHFTNSAGAPLIGGKLYAYDAGTSTPRTTYSDADATVPNTNPIILDSRGEATIFWSGAYKVVLKDSADVIIWAVDNVLSGNVSSDTLRTDLASTASGKGAAMVVLPTGRTVADKSSDVVSIFDSLTGPQRLEVQARTLGLDVSAACQAALAASKKIVFEEGAYYLGEYDSSNDIIFNLTSGRYDIRANGDVEFVVRTAAGVGDCFPVVFNVEGANKSKFGSFRFRDLGYSGSEINRRGCKPYRLVGNATTGKWGGVHIDAIHAFNCAGALFVEGADATNRVRGIHVDLIDVESCYYGVNTINNGDGLKVDLLIGTNVRRIYFAYGVTGHDVFIENRLPAGGTGAVNISRSPGGFDTRALKIKYVCRDSATAGTTHVNINHIDLLGGAIKGITLDLDIDLPVAFTPLVFVNYDGAGNISTAASANIVDGIFVRGAFGSNAADVDANASYSAKGMIDIEVFGSAVSGGLRAKFDLYKDSGSWSPMLVDSDLSTGEGQTAAVSSGIYSKIGKDVWYTGRLRMSSLGTLNPSSSASIVGFPFLSENVSSTNSVVNFGFGGALNIAAASAVTGYMTQNGGAINLQKWSATTGTAALAVSEISLDGDLVFSGHVRVQ